MCHCAPVLSIHNTASKTHRVGIGLRPGRPSGGALPENDSGCAPTARLSAESSDIYSRSTPPSNFEIGSRELCKCDARGGCGESFLLAFERVRVTQCKSQSTTTSTPLVGSPKRKSTASSL